MQTDRPYFKYAYYFEDLEKIAAAYIFKPIKMSDFKFSRGGQQSAYRERKEYEARGFKGTMLDYLCFVCMMYLAEYAFCVWTENSVERTEIFLEILLEQEKVATKLASRLYFYKPESLGIAFKILYENDNSDTPAYKILETLLKKKVSYYVSEESRKVIAEGE